MKLKKVQQILHASVTVAFSNWKDAEIISAYGSDLMRMH